MGVCSLRLYKSGFRLSGRCPCWSVIKEVLKPHVDTDHQHHTVTPDVCVHGNVYVL